MGVCAGFNINSELAFIGELAVIPKYQKFGIGSSLWNRCFEHCSNRNCAIFSEPKAISTLREKYGFRVIPARRKITYSGIPQTFALNKYIDYCDVEWITGIIIFFFLQVYCFQLFINTDKNYGNFLKTLNSS